MARRRSPRTIERKEAVSQIRIREAAPSLLAGVIAILLVASNLDPTGAYGWLPDGPGLTVDEMFNVEQGVRLEVGSRYVALGAMSLRELFGTPEELGPDAPGGYHLPDHPPLGRYLLGVAHDVVTSFSMPADWPSPIVTAAARFGSAIAFGVTAFLIASFSRRHFGPAAGWTSAAALVLMPRVFGHAHIASLETMIGLFFTATVLAVANRWKPGEAVTSRAAIVCGVLWGLALLTKVQAVLLPIPLAAWALWHWRFAAVKPLLVFGVVGAIIFFVGWPWLWSDPVGHVAQYLGRTTNRHSLPVWYAGQVFADKDVPWHYPFVMFAVTVPPVFLVLGGLGLGVKRPTDAVAPARRPELQLIVASLAFPLLLFAVPGVAVYDGVRLFLVSFPLYAILVGRGVATVQEWIAMKGYGRVAGFAFTALFTSQIYGVVATRPVYLSYYSEAGGGLAGATRLGFEPTYWGDSVTSELLAETAKALPEGSTLAVAPVLHQFQLDDLLTQSPALREKKIRLVEYRSEESSRADGLLVFLRKSSLPEELRDLFSREGEAPAEPRAVLDVESKDEAQRELRPPGGNSLSSLKPVAAVRVQGVTVAAFYRFLPRNASP